MFIRKSLLKDRYEAIFNTLNEDHSRLKKALPLLDYSRVGAYFGYSNKLKLSIDKFLEENPFNIRNKVDNSEAVFMQYITKSEAIIFEVNPPNGIILKPLREDHAETVNELWPHHHEGSLHLVKRFIKYMNLGAFTESGELVAWCLMLQLGVLGLLQVRESHKRQGFGSLLVKAMSKRLADEGRDICAPVVENNIASRNMFAKLGFKIIGKGYWNLVEKDTPYLWKDEYDS